MKFLTNTTPFADALALGVINSNVSNYHKKSNIVQLTATENSLRINVEAAQICSQMTLKGQGDAGETATIFVSSLLIKQLAATLDSNTITLEFADNGLIIHSGKSKYTLPKMIDDADIELTAPALGDYNTEAIAIDKSDWKFIKDRQMFAIAMSFIHPVYTKVWIGEDGDVLVGDFDNSLFTHAVKNKLGSTCLISDTIVNLFTSLPEGSKISKNGRDYVITYQSDSFDYITQFTPLYESDQGVGSYNSEIFLTMMAHPDNGVTLNPAALSKVLSQAALLGSSSDDSIKFSVADGQLHVTDSNVDCNIPINGEVPSFDVEFTTETLRKVIANYPDESITLSPMMQDGKAAGIIIWTKELTTILAGVED